jgi:hypothetical protein
MKKNVMVFDTETTSLNKPFCYNVGYIIATIDTDTCITESLIEKEFVIEQVWHNPMCFCSAYYADKRPLYVKAMRARKINMAKWGRVTQEMIRDIKKHSVVAAYAYNSPFDDKVFTFNCDWFKTINPFDDLPIYDIRGHVHNSLISNSFLRFCEENERFTDSGNYSTTAETVYQYIVNNKDFEEDHTALSDSKIELSILITALENGAELEKDYPIKRSIPRLVEKVLTIKNSDNKIIAQYPNYGYTVYKSKDTIKLK